MPKVPKGQGLGRLARSDIYFPERFLSVEILMSLRTFLPVFDFNVAGEILFFLRIFPSLALPFILLISIFSFLFWVQTIQSLSFSPPAHGLS